jgi:nitrous oxidase accessory protein NosD
MGREGALLHIHHNVIRHNSWDGIALYRGASALIHDNHISYGRGAGIGVTWSAQALIYRNVVEHYWKGIGAFGTSFCSCLQ